MEILFGIAVYDIYYVILDNTRQSQKLCK